MLEAEYVKEKLAEVGDPVFLLETLFAEAPVAFAIARVDGHIVVVNRAFRELFGSVPPPDYSVFKDELLAAKGVLPYFQRATEGHHAVLPTHWYDARELEHVQVEGRRVAIQVTMTPLCDRDRVVRHVAMSWKDVTAEHDLENKRQLLRTLFEDAPEAIVTYDFATGNIDDANSSAVRLFGRSLEELLALTPAGLSPERQPDGRRSDEALAGYASRARRGEHVELEWTFLTGAGEPFPGEVRLVLVRSDDHELARMSILDLRERKLIEAERERVRELQEQNLRMHEANRLKSEFLAAMSHELRTPLNTIIGFAELVFYDRVPLDAPEHKEFIGDILTSARHLLQLINDILDLAKIEAGKLEFRPERVVIQDVIAEVTGLLRALALQKRIQVQVEIDRSLEAVVLDPARFKQVLYNYLSNALKFTPEGGSIVVRTRPEAPDSFRIEVEDTGIGIAPEDLKRLFLEFEQLAAGAKKPEGTGLGLALTKRIVEAQGGSVGVRSSPGRGSVFHAVLPREPRPAQAL